MPSFAIPKFTVLLEPLWVSAEFLLLSTGPLLDIIRQLMKSKSPRNQTISRTFGKLHHFGYFLLCNNLFDDAQIFVGTHQHFPFSFTVKMFKSAHMPTRRIRRV